MQKIKTDNIEIIIDGDTAIINGVEYALKPKEVAEPEKPIHPFLKDVPEVGQRAYKFFPHGIGQSVDLVFPSEIDRGTVSLNRDALDEHSRLDPDAPTAIAFKEPSDNSQLSNTQNALRNLYKAVQKSRAVNDPLGMATAMEEAGKWF